MKNMKDLIKSLGNGELKEIRINAPRYTNKMRKQEFELFRRLITGNMISDFDKRILMNLISIKYVDLYVEYENELFKMLGEENDE